MFEEKVGLPENVAHGKERETGVVGALSLFHSGRKLVRTTNPATVISKNACRASQATCRLDDLVDNYQGGQGSGLHHPDCDAWRPGRWWLIIPSKGSSMHVVVGPVLTRKGGYAFDCWTQEEGLSRGYAYDRIEDAHYAR